jgi:hypothetical protein
LFELTNPHPMLIACPTLVQTIHNRDQKPLRMGNSTRCEAGAYSGIIKHINLLFPPTHVVMLPLKASDDEPVWRQVLRCHLNHSHRGVAQQAAAALEQGQGE